MCDWNTIKIFPNRYWWAMQDQRQSIQNIKCHTFPSAQHVMLSSSLSSVLHSEVYLLCWRCRSCWWGRVWWPPHNVSVPLQSLYSYMQNSQVLFPSRPVRGEIGRMWLEDKRLMKQHQSHETTAHHLPAGRRDWNWFTSRLFSGRSSSLAGGGWVSLGLDAGGGGGAGSSSISERLMPSNTESVVITLGSCSFLSSQMFNYISYIVIRGFIVFYIFNLIVVGTKSASSFMTQETVGCVRDDERTCRALTGCSWVAPTVLCSWDPTAGRGSSSPSPASGTSWASQKGSSLISLESQATREHVSTVLWLQNHLHTRRPFIGCLVSLKKAVGWHDAFVSVILSVKVHDPQPT